MNAKKRSKVEPNREGKKHAKEIHVGKRVKTKKNTYGQKGVERGKESKTYDTCTSCIRALKKNFFVGRHGMRRFQ